MKNITKLFIFFYIVFWIYTFYTQWMQYEIDFFSVISSFITGEKTSTYKDARTTEYWLWNATTYPNFETYSPVSEAKPLGAFDQIDKIEKLITYLNKDFYYSDPLYYIIEDDNPRPIINLWETWFSNPAKDLQKPADNINIWVNANTVSKIEDLKNRIKLKQQMDDEEKLRNRGISSKK